MPVPDVSVRVRSFLAPRLRRLGSTEATRANSFAAVRDACLDLRASDPRWGVLAKTSGDNVGGYAADIHAYDLGNGTCRLVDVVDDAEGEDGAPSATWSLVPDERAGVRPIAQWRVPPGASPVPSEPPAPQPSATSITIDLAAVIAAATAPLVAEVAALKLRVQTLENRPVAEPKAVSLTGRRIALRTSLGKLLCEDRDHHDTPDGSPNLLANRDAAGEWETLTIEEV